MDDKKKIIFVIVALFIIAIIFFKDYSESLEKKKELDSLLNELNGENLNSNYGLKISDDKSITDDYWYYVVGNLNNESNINYEQVLIQYIALDVNGYNIATCSDIAYNLNSGDSYPFKATCIVEKEKISSYKLKNITPVENIK